MLRKLIIAIAILAPIGAGACWILTIPKTLSPSVLGPHTADLENGRILFHAGGCASCHASPNQEDKNRLGGGLALKSAFGTFYAPNISPDRNDGIGNWTEAEFVTALREGTSPSGEHLYPAFPYTSYRQVARARVAVPVQYSARARNLEAAVPRARAVSARSAKIRSLQSRRLSGQRRGPLRRVPFSAQFSRRRHSRASVHWRAEPGRARLGAQHHPAGAPRLVAAGHRQSARDRRDAGRRPRRLRHGRGGAQHGAAAGAGPRRNRRLYQIVAAGRGHQGFEETRTLSRNGASWIALRSIRAA